MGQPDHPHDSHHQGSLVLHEGGLQCPQAGIGSRVDAVWAVAGADSTGTVRRPPRSWTQAVERVRQDRSQLPERRRRSPARRSLRRTRLRSGARAMRRVCRIAPRSSTNRDSELRPSRDAAAFAPRTHWRFTCGGAALGPARDGRRRPCRLCRTAISSATRRALLGADSESLSQRDPENVPSRVSNPVRS
jgi:hypothetical protein